MSKNQIPNQAVIPTIESDLFVGHEVSRFAVGIVGFGTKPIAGIESEFSGYGLLRGNVYAYQQNYMPVAELNPDGTETDIDDARSIHFAVIENAITSPRVIGAMRLIIKSREDPRALPIEEHYPEAFEGQVPPVLSTEVSRWICRHEDAVVQRNLKWPLFSAGVTAIMQNQLGPVYGAVKESLERGLRISGVPVTALAGAKYVPEFNASKLPIRIDINGLAERIENDQPDLMDAMRNVDSGFVYSGTAVSASETPATTVA